jgi:hypothetical protein
MSSLIRRIQLGANGGKSFQGRGSKLGVKNPIPAPKRAPRGSRRGTHKRPPRLTVAA